MVQHHVFNLQRHATLTVEVTLPLSNLRDYTLYHIKSTSIIIIIIIIIVLVQ